MATPPKEGKLIYHLTSIENLESILKNGLLSRNDAEEFVDVADREIILHREKEGLNSLVPFHFFPLNPFDGSVQKAHPDKKFIFITLTRKLAKTKGFKILPQHPLSLKECTLLDYDNGMNTINWDKMAERKYSDKECKEICMAECLTDTRIDAKDFFSIIVSDEEAKAEVIKLRDEIVGANNSFYVNVLNNIFVK
ncbi:MAG: DUF4433 domain-containing protein [Bacteroidetes bacterium]|nr:DUF4433 domain-containing protein [Bacteroidota bacterium]